jgi:cobalt-zinc-cadmium efflux system membrane fusion protein
MRDTWLSVVLGGLLLAAWPAAGGCKRAEERAERPVEAPPVASAHADEPEHEELPRRVRLTDQVIADARIETAPVGRERLAATLTLHGELIADPDRSARVTAIVGGRLECVDFQEGGRVKRGDALAVLRIPELGKIRGAYAATGAKAKAARANAIRVRGLRDQGLTGEQEAVNAEADALALAAESQALGDQLGSLGAGTQGSSTLVLRAPIDGLVLRRDAIVGQSVTPDQPIALLADLREVWFLGRVFEKDLGQLRQGAKAEVQLNAYPRESFEGSVEAIGRQIDPQARTVTARIRLTNRGDLLRLGLFGAARIQAGDGEPRPAALVVPRSSLCDIGGKTVVFVRQADDDFELHEVVLGEAALGKVEVLSGLREGERVVTAGVFTLKSVVLKATLAEAD